MGNPPSPSLHGRSGCLLALLIGVLTQLAFFAMAMRMTDQSVNVRDDAFPFAVCTCLVAVSFIFLDTLADWIAATLLTWAVWGSALFQAWYYRGAGVNFAVVLLLLFSPLLVSAGTALVRALRKG